MALSTQEQMLIEQRVTNETKSVVLAYMFWFFLGIVSGHRFYLGKPASAILQILSYFIIVGVIWYFVDLFLIPGMIRQHQERVRERFTRQYALSGGIR